MTIPGLRLVAVVALTWSAGLTCPPAGAVAPPSVDDALLPAPTSPAPREPTEQSQPCHAATKQADVGTARQLSGLDLQALWRLSRGAGQTVAVIDTGVARHRLLPHLVPGGDYVSTGDGTQDCDGHGTVVAGIIGAAEGGEGTTTFGGLAPDATIMAIRQSSNAFRRVSDTASSGVGDVETLASAVRTAADSGATVINISSVACVPADESIGDGALGAALAYAVDVKNVVIVAAAGNVGGPGQCREQNPPPDPVRPGVPDWDAVRVVVSPSWYDDYVLTVGSVGPDGRPSRFSLAGPWVDVAAPGEAVVSLDPDGEGLIDTFPGTAAPHADFGYELCRAGGDGHRGIDPVAGAGPDGEAGHATHRGHRAPSYRRLGRSGRSRCGRRVGGNQCGWSQHLACYPARDAVGAARRRARVRITVAADRIRRRRDLRGGGDGGVDALGEPTTTTPSDRHGRLTPRRC